MSTYKGWYAIKPDRQTNLRKGMNPFIIPAMGLWGLWLKVTGKRQGCCRLISDSVFWLFYFTPTLTGRCNDLPKKVPKELYKRKRQQQIRDKDVSFILSFIYRVQQPFHGWGSFFLNTLKWLNPPVKVSKNTLIRFMYVFVLIWYFGLP